MNQKIYWMFETVVSLWTGEWTVLGRDRSGKGDTLLVAINNANKEN